MELTIHVVDAFTQSQFKGNSAAVVLTERWLPKTLMQSIAAENNLSETAFVVKDEQDHYHIRWFSPLTEIAFCGHATLASAFVIFEGLSKVSRITFFAAAVGYMDVTKLDNGLFQMDFPNRKPKLVNELPEELIKGLSIKPKQVLVNDQAYFAVYDNEHDVSCVEPRLEELKQLAPLDVVVTAPSSDFDFCSRYFWPANGGDEDPVTGSIHTGLAPYWAEILGKSELVAIQASTRTGVLYCQVTERRVQISGHAVQYLQGSINVPDDF